MTTDNRAAFEEFVDVFYRRKRVAEAFALLVSDAYRQHNPTIADGPAAAVEALTPKFDGSPDARFEVQRILKAFVDAQWLAEFDARLAAYRAQLAGSDDEE